MDKLASSRNDEFFTPRYAVDPLMKYIPREATVWCPFDLESSRIASSLRFRGCRVITTHISNGEDFFLVEPPVECGYIISNPPYSLKTEVFRRLFELKIPFAMLVGVAGLFEGEKRFSLFSANSHEVMWLSKRVDYLKSPSDVKPTSNTPFSSVWVTKGVLPEKNVFERIYK